MSVRYGTVELRRVVIAYRDGDIIHSDMAYRMKKMRHIRGTVEFLWFDWVNIPDIIVRGANDPYDLKGEIKL